MEWDWLKYAGPPLGIAFYAWLLQIGGRKPPANDSAASEDAGEQVVLLLCKRCGRYGRASVECCPDECVISDRRND